MEIEGFGPLTVKEVLALHANVDGLGLAWMSGSRGDGKESAQQRMICVLHSWSAFCDHSKEIQYSSQMNDDGSISKRKYSH